MPDRNATLAAVRTLLSRLPFGVWLAMITAISVLLGPGMAAAQPLPNDVVSIEPAVIASQLRAALTLGEQAKDRLASADTDIAPAHKALDTMYRQIRRALGNMNDRKVRLKFPDPVLDVEISRVTFAWNTIRRPVDSYFNSPVKEEWRASAARDLQTTMATLRQVEALLP